MLTYARDYSVLASVWLVVGVVCAVVSGRSGLLLCLSQFELRTMQACLQRTLFWQAVELRNRPELSYEQAVEISLT